MKKFLVAMTMSVAAVAARPVTLDPISVKEIVQTANLMPGPGPARPIHTKIAFEVSSNGCTDSEDFDVTVEQRREGQYVRILRVRPDNCKRLAGPVTIELETTKLGNSQISAVFIANPSIVETHFVY